MPSTFTCVRLFDTVLLLFGVVLLASLYIPATCGAGCSDKNCHLCDGDCGYKYDNSEDLRIYKGGRPDTCGCPGKCVFNFTPPEWSPKPDFRDGGYKVYSKEMGFYKRSCYRADAVGVEVDPSAGVVDGAWAFCPLYLLELSLMSLMLLATALSFKRCSSLAFYRLTSWFVASVLLLAFFVELFFRGCWGGWGVDASLVYFWPGSLIALLILSAMSSWKVAISVDAESESDSEELFSSAENSRPKKAKKSHNAPRPKTAPKRASGNASFWGRLRQERDSIPTGAALAAPDLPQQLRAAHCGARGGGDNRQAGKKDVAASAPPALAVSASTSALAPFSGETLLPTAEIMVAEQQGSVAAELERLSKLKDEGSLSDAEFKEAKQLVLHRMA